MANNPEANYIKKVHRQLDNRVYHQGMGLTATNGTPDVYYEGRNSILWVEYKWIEKPPNSIDFSKSAKPKISKLQLRWLKRARKNNIPVSIIMGTEHGGFVFSEDEIDRHKVLKPVGLTHRQVAEWIEFITMG